eukprot:m.332451 g.332451  ORF g.332451 m.332451 type:complete len:581 (+) comp16516_c0_seq4:1738-3480(+)
MGKKRNAVTRSKAGAVPKNMNTGVTSSVAIVVGVLGVVLGARFLGFPNLSFSASSDLVVADQKPTQYPGDPNPTSNEPDKAIDLDDNPSETRQWRQPVDAPNTDSIEWAIERYENALQDQPPISELRWPENTSLSELASLAIAEWKRLGGQPIVIRGAPLYEWDAWPTMQKSANYWLEQFTNEARAHLGPNPIFRPKVGNRSMFQYFQSKIQETWRQDFGVEPPPTDWVWDLECNETEQLRLLSGTQPRTFNCPHNYGYWITRAYTTEKLSPGDTQEVSVVADAIRRSSRKIEDFMVGPTFNEHGPVTGKLLDSNTVNLWITSPGVANNLHYDVSWNFLVHASGPKRVAIAPLSARQKFHFTPRVHPGLRSSPLDLRRPWKDLLTDAPELESSGLMQTTLAPGDILMIPPLWLHFLFVGNAPTASFSFFTGVLEEELGAVTFPKLTEGASVSFSVKLLKNYFGNRANAAKRLNRILKTSYQWNTEISAQLCPRNARHAKACKIKITAQDKQHAKGVADAFLSVVNQMRQPAHGMKQLVPEETLEVFIEQWITDDLMRTFGPTQTCGVLENCVLRALQKAA